MTEFSGLPVEYKIAPPESMSIIGSNSINTAGDLYMINFNSIARGHNRRSKRLFDIGVSFMFILIWPFFAPFFKGIRSNFANALKVMISSKTWIAYCSETDLSGLPVLKKGIFEPSTLLVNPDKETKEKINIEYARDYKIAADFSILWRNVFNLLL
jgi:lipopolysaccharide/colanic/teichoic acid biosynthesis glycosyltransferase